MSEQKKEYKGLIRKKINLQPGESYIFKFPKKLFVDHFLIHFLFDQRDNLLIIEKGYNRTISVLLERNNNEGSVHYQFHNLSKKDTYIIPRSSEKYQHASHYYESIKIENTKFFDITFQFSLVEVLELGNTNTD